MDDDLDKYASRKENGPRVLFRPFPKNAHSKEFIAFAKNVKVEADKLPPYAKRIMSIFQSKIKVASYPHQLDKEHTRPYGPKTIGQHENRKITLSATTLNEPDSPQRYPTAVGHETAHLLTQIAWEAENLVVEERKKGILGFWYKQEPTIGLKIHELPSIVRAYEQDLSAIDKDQYLDYYLPTTKGGRHATVAHARNEAFTEAWSLAMAHGIAPEDKYDNQRRYSAHFKKIFPNLVKEAEKIHKDFLKLDKKNPDHIDFFIAVGDYMRQRSKETPAIGPSGTPPKYDWISSFFNREPKF